MKKEASGKKGKVLWLILGIVLVLAIAAGVVAAFLLGGQEDTMGGRPVLYWNIDRESNVDTATGLSIREPAEDGNFYVRFAYEGEQIELPVADKKLVNYIDGQSLMHLVLDKSGFVVDVLPPQAVANVVGETLYVQSVEGDTLIANSSIAMNGRKVTIKLNDEVTAYNVSGKGKFVGEPLEVSELNTMDTIGVYGTFVPEDSEEESVVTHIFVTKKPVESPVYWRADQFYDSSNKVTTRVPDENGAYTIKWFVDGETVELKCKDKQLVSSIDQADYHWCHWGLEFDEDGYIIDTPDSFLTSRTLLQCERFDITELYDDGSYVATSLIKNNGSTVQGVVGPECKIYDVSKTARSEWDVNRKIDSLKLGDRVCIWTDTAGKPVLIYVTNRLVEGPAYWNVTRSYSSATQQSTRTPNAQGLYEIELLRVGDKKNTIYYAKDIETATIIDAPTDRCCALKVGENNVIEYAYESECLFGNTYLCRGYFVMDITGSVGTYLSNAGSGFSRNAVLAEGCKVINISTVGEYGAETTLGFGDAVFAYKSPIGEIAHVFVFSRLTGIESMHYRITKRAYDSEKKVTTREPDADGYYVYEFTSRGKTKILKTKNKEIANKIDASSRAEMALELRGDIIVAVHSYSYPLGGNTNSGYYVKAIKGDQITIWNTSGKEYTETLADYCEIYNVSTSFLDYFGEKTTLKVGDYVNIFRDVYYNVGFIYVTGRQTNKMAWPVDPQYDSTNACTTRTPDANGWYYIDLAVDGKVSTFKTKNKNVINAADSYISAFGIKVSGSEILYTSTYGYVENVRGKGITNYTVASVSGNKVKTIYTLGDATATGTKKELTLNTGVKIFDVSDPKSADFGKAVKLQVGDMICTYTNLVDKELTQYVYIVARCTRQGGYMSYCDHCSKVVYWNPYISSANAVRYDCHYYLAADVNHDSQMRVYGSSQDNLEIVLDLNGHTLSREAGRLVFVRYGATLTIIDSVGGGQIKSRNNNSIGGVLSVGGPEEGYGASTLNLYAGTITMDTDADVVDYPYRAALVTSNGYLNMYGGEITGGYVRGKNSSGSSAAGVQINDGEFNMYAGKISNCIAEGGFYEVALLDPNGNPVIDETTGQPKTKVTEITSYGGNLHVNGANAVVNMYGGSIENGKAARGGNVTVANGTFILHDGTISGGVASAEYGTISDGRGGNFFVTGSSNVYIKGGVVKDGKATDGSGMGGNFVGSSFKSTIHIQGGTVTNGEAKNGNGNNVALMYSNLNVSGGNITMGNYTTGNAVSTAGTASGGYSTVTVSGGKVEGQVLLNGGTDDTANVKYPDYRAIANISGGTIDKLNAERAQSVTVSGKPVIKNVQLAIGLLLNVGKMVDGADVTVNTTGVFTKPVENAADYTGYFHSTATDYVTGTTAENELRFYHPYAETAHCDHCDGDAEWMPWDGTAVTPGHYYLTENVQLTQEMTVDVEVVYDLRGHTVTAAADCRTFNVGGTGALNIMDSTSTAKGAVIGGEYAGRGANIYVNTSGVLNLYSGAIVGGNTTGASSDGRGGNIFAYGNVTLFGGTVKDGVAMSGNGLGANIMITGATLTIHKDATVTNGQGKNGNNICMMYATLVNYGKVSNGTVTEGRSITANSMEDRTVSTVRMEAGEIDGLIYIGSGTPAAGVEDYRTVLVVNGGKIGAIEAPDAYANTITLTGAPVIDSMTLGAGVKVDPAQLSTNASVKINATEGVFTDVLTNADDVVGYFDAVANGYDVVVNDEKKLEVVSNGSGTPTPGPSGSECEHCNSNVEWTAWDGAAVTAGHYYLTDNVTLTNELSIAADVVIDLKGYSITAAAGKRTFNIAANGALSILDTSAAKTGAVIGGEVAARGANIYVNTNATFNLYGGTIIGGNCTGATSAGRGGNIFATGAVNLYGGTVKGGKALAGHGLGGNIMMTGATLTVYENAAVIGGEAKNGNNVSLMYATLVNYGTISNGDVTSGNSVNASSMEDRATSVFTMEGGKIDGIVQINSGTPKEGVADYRTKVTVKGGEIAELKVVDAYANSIAITGAPVIKKLTMTAGIQVNATQLTTGASVKVNATEGIITDALTNANDVVGYFDTVAVDRKVIVNTESKLEIVEACICGCKALASEIEWVDMNAYVANNGSPTNRLNGNLHFYLSANLNVSEIFGTAKQITFGRDSASNFVIDLRGYQFINQHRVYLYAGSTMTIVDSSAEGTGVWSTTGDVNRSTAGRAFYVKGTLNLRSGTIKLADNANVVERALIHLDAGVFNMYGGTVTGGKAETNGTTTANIGRGGNIYVTNGQVNIYGGTVSNGTATNLTLGQVEHQGLGGNIYVTSSAELNIYGGTITGGVAAKGADIYLEAVTTAGAKMNISGGTVAGEVFVEGAKATATVSGAAKIGNLNLQADSLVTVGELVSGAQIGITKNGDFTAVLEDPESYLPFFTSVQTGKEVKVTVDNKLTLFEDNLCACGCGAEKAAVVWVDPTAFFNAEHSNDFLKIGEDVHLRLENNFSVETFFGESHQITIGTSDTASAKVTIDLNGYTWSSNTRAYVYKTSTLTIMDSSAAQTGKMTGVGTTTNGRVIVSTGTLNLLSGTLTMTKEGAIDCTYAGVVYVSQGVFNMYGGQIVDGEALAGSSEGGNVYIWKGTFNMYGGTVSGGSATKGANVFVHKAGAMNHMGGTIADKANTVYYAQ